MKQTNSHHFSTTPNRPSTLNPLPTDPKPMQARQAIRVERDLHRQVMKTIRETFGGE